MYCQTKERRYHTTSGPDRELRGLRENSCQGREGEGERAYKGDYSIEGEA